MKTSKRKRSAKAASVTEASGVDVISAEAPVAIEPALEAAAESGATSVVESTVAVVASDAVAEGSINEASEFVADAATEQVAELAAEAPVERIAEGAIEQTSDLAQAVAVEAVAELAAESVEANVAEANAELAAEAVAPEAVVGEPIVVLGSNCSVKDAAALKTSLCAFSNHGDAVTLDVSAVERVDTATMQLLCAFVRDRSGRNQSVTWRGESQALQDAVRLLGVGELLGFETKGVAA